MWGTGMNTELTVEHNYALLYNLCQKSLWHLIPQLAAKRLMWSLVQAPWGLLVMVRRDHSHDHLLSITLWRNCVMLALLTFNCSNQLLCGELELIQGWTYMYKHFCTVYGKKSLHYSTTCCKVTDVEFSADTMKAPCSGEVGSLSWSSVSIILWRKYVMLTHMHTHTSTTNVTAC